MVIYADTKLLPYYLCILGEIEKEYPDIIKRCGRPPILSGVIRNWIGYGSEPIELSLLLEDSGYSKNVINTLRENNVIQFIKKEIIPKINIGIGLAVAQ